MRVEQAVLTPLFSCHLAVVGSFTLPDARLNVWQLSGNARAPLNGEVGRIEGNQFPRARFGIPYTPAGHVIEKWPKIRGKYLTGRLLPVETGKLRLHRVEDPSLVGRMVQERGEPVDRRRINRDGQAVCRF